MLAEKQRESQMIVRGNVLARATFDQTDVDRPLLDLNEGAWKNPTLNKSLGTEPTQQNGQLTEEEKDEMFMQFGGKAAREKAASLSTQKGFSLVSNSKIKLHEKVLSMVFDGRQRLFSIGTERKIMITDLRPMYGGQRMFSFVKLSNGNPVTLEVASESSRLFCSTTEGLLLIFDISRKDPVMVHSLRLVLNPGKNLDYACQLVYDGDRNLLLCRLKSSAILLIQLGA
jgi:hypothetical protein